MAGMVIRVGSSGTLFNVAGAAAGQTAIVMLSRSEASRRPTSETLRYAQGDKGEFHAGISYGILLRKYKPAVHM